MDADLLYRHLPPGYRRLRYFVCGPAAMMRPVEGALKELGVDGERVSVERFSAFDV